MNLVQNLPKGAKPRYFVEHKRAEELSDTINNFIKTNCASDVIPIIKDWCNELIERLDKLSELDTVDPLEEKIYYRALRGESKNDCIIEYKRIANVNQEIAKKRVEAMFSIAERLIDRQKQSS